MAKPRATAASFAVALLLAAVAPLAFALPAMAQDPEYDEFGRIPAGEPGDKDLSLPDPVLDRTWPDLTPGQPEPLVPEDDEGDLFESPGEPTRPTKPEPRDQAPPEPRAPRPERPLIGPDGKLDAGSPLVEPAPHVPEVLERDVPEPSEMEEEENRPSPLDQREEDFDDPPDPLE